MKYEVCQSRQYPDEWHVEAIGSDGEMYVVVFSGPLAESRAKEYAAWKNEQVLPKRTSPHPYDAPKFHYKWR